ncbi:MAG: hypothetical protein M1820_009273 [Bogoriella megaspora]|nr:MAG: hypothetical protein M1820_009273 [Bogoriella megaspora]
MASAFPVQELGRLTGHKGPVHAVTYSGGVGQYILTGCADRSIRFYNPSSSKLIQTFNAHGYEVLGLAVAPDNSSFASVGGDKTVFLWDVTESTTKRRWSGHNSRVNTVAFGGDGGVVVSGSYDTTVKLWDAKSHSGKPLMTLSDAKDSISSVAVSETEIVAGCVDGKVRIYDLRTGMCYADVVGQPVTSVKPNRQNDSLLVSTMDSTIRLFDKANGALLKSYTAPEYMNKTYRLDSTSALADSFVLSGSEDGRILIWDYVTGHVVHKLRHSSASSGSDKTRVVSSVAFNENKREWCSAGGDGVVVVWGSER